MLILIRIDVIPVVEISRLCGIRCAGYRTMMPNAAYRYLYIIIIIITERIAESARDATRRERFPNKARSSSALANFSNFRISERSMIDRRAAVEAELFSRGNRKIMLPLRPAD